MTRAVSIIIPALNEEDYLPRLLDSVAGQDFDGEYEIIVVDGNSDDRTVDRVSAYESRFKHLTVLRRTPDIGAQRNLGAGHARYELLLFLDADVELPKGTLRKIVRRAGSHRNFVMSVPHRTDSVTFGEAIFGVVIYLFVLVAFAFRFPVTNGDFLFTSRTQHAAVGGFAEGALLGEDTDYGLRAVRRGARYLYCWTASVIASDRRLQSMSLVRIARVWIYSFVHVLRNGPVYDRQRFAYPFGHYAPPAATDRRRRRFVLYRRTR